MPIFDQGYQHWHGTVGSHAWRWLAISRQGVRQQLRRRRTKWLVAWAFLPALGLAIVLILWGLLEQQSTLLDPIRALLQVLPAQIQAGPKAYRTAVWTYAFNVFFSSETFFSMLLVMTVGPDLVSQDLRFNAMPLYFSRPIRRIDYFLGKLGVIGFFLAAVAIAPAVTAYVLGLAFSFDASVIQDTWHLLAGAVIFGLIVVVSAGTLMLAVSSLTRNSRLIGAMWVGLWVMSNITAYVLQQRVDQEWCALVSYTANLDRLREELLDVASARAKFVELWSAGQQTSRDAIRSVLPFGPRRKGFRPPPPPPIRSTSSDWSQERLPPFLQTPWNVRHPWTWSAGVLAGLFVFSACILSTRVKSMDRLR